MVKNLHRRFLGHTVKSKALLLVTLVNRKKKIFVCLKLMQFAIQHGHGINTVSASCDQEFYSLLHVARYYERW
jgi:hypothetical protein